MRGLSGCRPLSGWHPSDSWRLKEGSFSPILRGGRARFPGLFGGVGFAADGFELLDADLGVDGGGFEFFVTEKLLDEADVGSAFEHVGGTGV